VPRHPIDASGSPLLDIGSYGQHGPRRREPLSQEQIAYIRRTVHYAPEVMVKVLTQGGQDLQAVTEHLKYLSRDGDLQIETDDGERLSEEGFEQALVKDWDLDLEEVLSRVDDAGRPRRPPKLVHKIVFSMPADTPAQKMLTAVRDFARDEFGAKHRYAMVLHTDEPHPHVHVLVKAMGDAGGRLNIKKATLREWRREFARHLRQQGIAANATARAARGASRPQKLDGIHRAAMRGASTHYRRKVNEATRELNEGLQVPEPGKERLMATRREVVRGWQVISDQLAEEGHFELAREVQAFIARMPAPRTEKEMLKAAILEKARAKDSPDRQR
jgi:hypothetical protein